MNSTGRSSGWLLGKLRKGQVWCALLSLSLGLSVASAIETSRIDSRVEMPELEDRAIDPTLADSRQVAEDQMPAGRFYISLGTSFLVAFLALSLLNGWIVQGLLGEAMEKEKSGVLLLSQISLALYALHLVVGEAVPLSLRSLLHFLCALLVLSMIAKSLVAVSMRSDKQWALVWNLLNDDQLMLAGFFLPAVVISLVGWFRGSNNPMAAWPAFLACTVYFLVLLALLGLYGLIARRAVASARGGMALALYDLNTAVIVAGAPLTLLPLGALVARETQSAFPAIDPRAIGLAVLAVLVGASLALFVLKRQGKLRIGAVAVLTGFYFPVTVATLASFKTHVWTLKLGTLDYFRAGEQVVPAQQWSEFGSVPLLDLLPGQGLADVGIQSLYCLFNGVQGLDMLVWLPWIPVAVGFVIIYAFLALVTSPVLALLVTVLLPVKAVVVGQYAVALLPAVALVAALRRPGWRPFLILWSTSALLMIWRPGLGWAAGLAVVAVVSLAALLENRDILAPAAASLALVVGLFPAGLLIAEVVWGGDTYAAVVDYFGLLRDSQSLRFGALEIESGFQGMASVLQQLLPILPVLCVLYFLLIKFVRQQAFSASSYAVLYLALFSSAVPTRSGAVDGASFFDPSLLLLTLALIPFLTAQTAFRPRQIGRSTWLLTSLVLGAFLGSLEIYSLLGPDASSERQHAWKMGEPRVSFNSQPHKAVVKFLQQELDDEDTFVDFTGSTALYALAGRRYPLREVSDFRVTSEGRQRSQIASLEKERLAGSLPLVLFRSPPKLSGSSTDFPTEAISYRIAELIYAHYLPFAKVGGWEIWRERGVRRGKPTPPAKIISSKSVQQNFQLGNLPHRWAAEDPWQAVSKTDVQVALLAQPVVLRAGVPMSLPWSPEVDSPVPTYFHLRARPLSGPENRRSGVSSPTLTFSYGLEPQNTFGFRLAHWLPQNPEGDQKIRLPLRDTPKKHKMRRVSRYADRNVFRSTGKDPWLHGFADLSAAPAAEAGMEQWIRLSYHSSESGIAQMFFAPGDGEFKESYSVKSALTATHSDGSPRQITVPVLGVEPGSRLAKLRIDPPAEGHFEIVDLELIHRPLQPDDYLVRLTTQFDWATGPPRSLTLESDSPVLIDSVYLRTGD